MKSLGPALLAGALLVACGARSDVVRPGDRDDGAGDDGDDDDDDDDDDGDDGDDDDDGASSCGFDRPPLETQPGACAAEGLECGAECGDCASLDATCFEQRCYHPEGIEPAFVPGLLRGLYGDPEGIACRVQASGVLERVEVALWDAGASAARMEVWLPCDGGHEIAATVTRPAGDLPAYDGIHGEMRATTFVLDPPLRVEAGEEVWVTFTAEDAHEYTEALVTGLDEGVDSNPDCFFIRLPDWPTDSFGAEFMARLHIH